MSITTTGMMGSSVDAQVNNGRDYRQGGVLVIACGMGYWLRATMTMKRQCCRLVALHIIVINPLQSKACGLGQSRQAEVFESQSQVGPE